jgi:hypothetical protein
MAQPYPTACAQLLAQAVSFAPEEMRRKQLASIVARVPAGALAQAIVLAFEDLQWADPTSIDVIRALAERGGQAPLFSWQRQGPNFVRRGTRASFRSRPSIARWSAGWSGSSLHATRFRRTSSRG